MPEEVRVFRGKLAAAQEMWTQDYYIVTSEDPIDLAWQQLWFDGLVGKNIELTIRVLD